MAEVRLEDAIDECSEYTGLSHPSEGTDPEDARWFGTCVASRLSDLGFRYLGATAEGWPACPEGTVLDWRARTCAPAHRFTYAMKCAMPSLPVAPGLCPSNAAPLGAISASVLGAVGVGALFLVLLAWCALRRTADGTPGPPVYNRSSEMLVLRRDYRRRSTIVRVQAPPFLVD